MNSAQRNVVIVDDIFENLEIVSEILSEEGINVIEVQDGELALQKIVDEKPDLILLDIFMPKIDGFEVCKMLKNNSKTIDIPVIFLTTSDEPDHIIKGFNCGAIDYIKKPFNPEELIKRVNTHVELKKVKEKLLVQNHQLIETNDLLTQSTKALSMSNKRYKDLFENSNDGIILHNLSGDILKVNHTACNIFNYNEAKLLNTNLKDLSIYRDRKLIVSALKRLSRNGIDRFDAKFIKSDKEVIFLNISSNVVDEEQNIAQSVIRDFTAERKITQDLKGSEKYFREIYDSSPFSILTINTEGSIIDLNPATLVFFEIPYFSDLMKKDIFELPYFKNTQLFDDIQFVARNSNELHTEYKILTNKGNEVWGNCYLIPSLNKYRKVSHIYIIIEDYTQKKSSESELKKMSTVVEQSKSAIVITDTEGVIEYANPAFTETTGYPVHEAIGKTPAMVKSGKNKKEDIKDLWETIKSGKSWYGELINKKKNGELFYEKSVISPIKNENGIITNYAAIKEDITVQKQALLDLKDSENKFKQLSELTFEGILIHQNGIVIDVNTSFLNLIGYALNEVVYVNIIDLIITENFKQKFIDCINEGGAIPFEIEIQTKANSLIPIETQSQNIVYNGHKAVVTAFRDITERKKAELEIMESERKLKEAQKMGRLGHWTLDFENLKLQWSDEVFRIFEIDPAEVENTYETFLQFVHPDDKAMVDKAFQDSVANKSEYDVVHRIILGNKKIKYIHEKGTTIYDNNGNPVQSLGITQDITDVKQKEELLNKQKLELEDANKEIISSINYAKIIQTAVMPSPGFFKQFIPESFILFLPRDIVSGDFYWIKQIQEKVFLAAADCTGHGVPGAFMSMLGIAYLNEAISSFDTDTKINPGEILNELRHKIKLSLHQDHRKHAIASNGIDMALCSINLKEKKLEYAGANNPIYIIRWDAVEQGNIIIDYAADRQPIGVHLKEKPFTNHEIQLQSNDVVYMFSDGYVDQFGGEHNQKYKFGRFKSLLKSIASEPLDKQKQLLEEEFLNWKGEERAQLDDILLIGFKVSESYGDFDLF